MSTQGLGTVDEANLHLYTDARSTRLAKLAEESIAGLFRDLGGVGKQQGESRIDHLRGFIEAVSGYFHIEMHLLLEERKPHADTKNDRDTRVLWERSQRSDGINEYSGMVVRIHFSSP
jgi:hypothetical protein